MMKIVRYLTAVLLAVSLAVPAFSAPAGGSPPAGDRPCQADVMKYCADHMGDRAAMGTCMRENQGKFSEQCRNAIQARQQARQAQGQGQGQGQGAGHPDQQKKQSQ